MGMTTRRSIFKTVAALFVGTKVVPTEAIPHRPITSRMDLLMGHYPLFDEAGKQKLLDELYRNLKSDCADVWEEGNSPEVGNPISL